MVSLVLNRIVKFVILCRFPNNTHYHIFCVERQDKVPNRRSELLMLLQEGMNFIRLYLG